jgi:N utilization substance protein A
VHSIIRELRGEKIDIIEYSEDRVTFAQSALAPARITRVSVTHEGATPHLDVIVEDEQLSLAIGKRGQNVRLASELIGARIDIKSETDVKDEVADALARMLNVDRDADELDLTEIPGVDDGLAAALSGAGLGELEALENAGVEALTMVPGVDDALAAAILDWAAERSGSAETGDAAADTDSPPMDEDDFMAALTRAFSEETREEEAGTADEGGDNDTDNGAA